MNEPSNRRHFIKQSSWVTAGVIGMNLPGVQSGSIQAQGQAVPTQAKSEVQLLPQGKLGSLSVSRLMMGANMISGWGHYRDLLFVGKLARAYNTEAKVFDTLELAEVKGINTILLNHSQLSIIRKYRQERKGSIQAIAGIEPTIDIAKSWDQIQNALEDAAAVYIDGVYGDTLVRDGQFDVIQRTFEQVRKSGRLAGIGSHSLMVPKACESRGLEPDFYVKTFHSDDYWSATPKEKRKDYCWYSEWSKDHGEFHDNMWCLEPEETAIFMGQVKKPWIAFKVLAAGVIHSRSGFTYAFEKGADFIAVGMYDFEIAENVTIARNAINSNSTRSRPWRA